MNEQRSGSWQGFVRWFLLLALVVIGLAIAAGEQARPDVVTPIFNRMRPVFDQYLNPVRARTMRWTTSLLQLNELWRVEQVNRQLRREVRDLRTRNQLIEAELGRMRRMAGLARWSVPAELALLPADVIGWEDPGQSEIMIINRGRIDQVLPHDPVVAESGLVGVVRSIDRGAARVQTIADPLSAVGVISREQRSRGIIYGRGRNQPLEFFPENEVQPIVEGTILITSGFEDSVFPKGIVVGEIVAKELNPYGLPYGVVEPAAQLQKVEEVLLILPAYRFEEGEDQYTTGTLSRFRIEMLTTETLKAEIVPTSASLKFELETSPTLNVDFEFQVQPLAEPTTATELTTPPIDLEPTTPTSEAAR